MDDATLNAMCVSSVPDVLLENNNCIVSAQQCDGVLLERESGESVNVEDNIDEVSSSACSEELRPDILDHIIDSDDSDDGDIKKFDGDGNCKQDDSAAAPLYGVRGPKSVSILEHFDCDKLIRIARDINADNFTSSSSRWAFCESIREEADFAPADVFAILIRVFDDWQQLSRVLQLDWVRSWEGWTDIRQKLDACSDINLKQFLCEDVVREFCNICMRDVVQEDYSTDEQRRQQLVDLGYKIGKGSGHNCNCLIDSLLQLLVHHNVVKGPPSRFPMSVWRNELCEIARSHLCNHDNIALRPRLRDENYKENHATKAQHSWAFLEHHKHGKNDFTIAYRFSKVTKREFRAYITYYRFLSLRWQDR